MAGGVEHQHVLGRRHQTADMAERQRQCSDRAVRRIVAGAVRPGEHQRASLGPVALPQNPPRLARLAGEDRIAVERDGDDKGVGRAGRVGSERGQRGIEPALLFAQGRRRDPALQLRPEIIGSPPLGPPLPAPEIGIGQRMRRRLVRVGGRGLRKRRGREQCREKPCDDPAPVHRRRSCLCVTLASSRHCADAPKAKARSLTGPGLAWQFAKCRISTPAPWARCT